MTGRRKQLAGWRHVVACVLALGAVMFVVGTTPLFAQEQPGEAPPRVRLPEAQEFFVHEFHATQLELDCSVCHVTEGEDSTVMVRPHHDRCELCHQDNFEQNPTPKFCGQCHAEFPPLSNEDLLPFPLYRKQRAILFDFSHALHVDPGARNDAKTGFRGDCTYCHQFDEDGVFASFPRHPQCQGCHQDPMIKPNLTPSSDTADCRGCHNPEEIENPGYTKERVFVADHVVSGVHVNLHFSHVAHFRVRDKYDLNCTTCHYAVPQSTSFADLALPQMLDCVECHHTDKDMPAQFRMSNCNTCHIEVRTGPLPASHSSDVKPPFHDESFRLKHETMAREPGAKCYVCHTNVAPSMSAEGQCDSCHQVMRPQSHTVRWRDDIHGKQAALDRTTCAACHTADTCIRCHNQVPRSHQPLALFKAGAHANLAMLEQRACFTCHTFDDTCSACHLR